jgi:hypothetical protein
VLIPAFVGSDFVSQDSGGNGSLTIAQAPIAGAYLALPEDLEPIALET